MQTMKPAEGLLSGAGKALVVADVRNDFMPGARAQPGDSGVPLPASPES